MQDNITLVFCVIMTVLFFVIFPLYNLFERQDDMAYATVLRVTSNFTDQIRINGYIDEPMLGELITNLSTTGNIYDIQIEAHRQIYLRDAADRYSVGYVIDYTDDIFTYTTMGLSNINYTGIALKNDIYYLEKGDKIFVHVKNTNTTLATVLLNFLKLTDRTEKINVRYGGNVFESTWKQ